MVIYSIHRGLDVVSEGLTIQYSVIQVCSDQEQRNCEEYVGRHSGFMKNPLSIFPKEIRRSKIFKKEMEWIDRKDISLD